MDHFKLHSKYKPTGDQPQAIEELVRGFREGNQFETLLGVTGSGKIMRSKAYKSHIMTKKSQKRKRNFRHETEVATADNKVIARNLGLR